MQYQYHTKSKLRQMMHQLSMTDLIVPPAFGADARHPSQPPEQRV